MGVYLISGTLDFPFFFKSKLSQKVASHNLNISMHISLIFFQIVFL